MLNRVLGFPRRSGISLVRTCVCKNNAHPLLKPSGSRLSRLAQDSVQAILKKICGSSAQRRKGLAAATRNSCANQSERLFRKHTHHGKNLMRPQPLHRREN